MITPVTHQQVLVRTHGKNVATEATSSEESAANGMAFVQKHSISVLTPGLVAKTLEAILAQTMRKEAQQISMLSAGGHGNIVSRVTSMQIMIAAFVVVALSLQPAPITTQP